MNTFSPIGGGEEVAQTFLRHPQNKATLEVVEPHIPTRGPLTTASLFMIAYWDRAWCVDLKLRVPWRKDVKEVCP